MRLLPQLAIALTLMGAVAYAQPAFQGAGLLAYRAVTCVDRDGDGYGVGPLVVVSTSVSSSISAGVQTVTPVSMAGIMTNMALRIDVWPNIEFVVVAATTGSTFTATFLAAHGSSTQVTDSNCLGPDADDGIGPVATWPQAKAVYGSFPGWLTHFGYAPAHIWYLAPASATANCLANLASGEPPSSCAGNDSTGVEDDPTKPFLTWTHINASVTSGMAVVLRDGFDDRIASTHSGTSGNPILLLGYPGEQPHLDNAVVTNAQVNIISQSWWVVDNVWVTGSNPGPSACFAGGDGTYATIPHLFHDNIFRHIRGDQCHEGFGPLVGFQNLTIENSLFDHNNLSNSEAGIYVGSGCTVSTGLVIQGNITHDNNYSGIHTNGLSVGGLYQQNIVYSNNIEGITFQSGVNNSTVQSNLSFNNNGADFELYTYKASGGSVTGCDTGPYTITGASWSSGTATLTMASHTMVVGQNVYIYGMTPSGYNCLGQGCVLTAVNQGAGTVSFAATSNPGSFSAGGTLETGVYDQTGNVIQNNTFYHGNREPNGGLAFAQATSILINNKDQTTGLPEPQNLGGNTFRNNIFVNYGDCAVSSGVCVPNANYRSAPVNFTNGFTGSTAQPVNFQTTTFDHNLFYQQNGVNGGHAAFAIGTSASNTCSSQCNAEVVYGVTGTPLNGGTPVGFTTGGMTGNLNSDPGLVSASQAYYNTQQWDLRILDNSPALHAGSSTFAPVFDVIGRAYLPAAPSIGGVERQLYLQGWTDLGSGSNMTAAICPANGAVGSVDHTGSPYPYQTNCHTTYDTWNSGVLREHSGIVQMILWGGGHTDSGNNQMYQIPINTTSPLAAAVTTSPSTPSRLVAGDYAGGPEGLPSASPAAPNSVHTYSQIAYIPGQDAYHKINGSIYGNANCYMDSWEFSFGSGSWAALDPLNGTAVNTYPTNCSSHSPSYLQIGTESYDSVSQQIYFETNGFLFGYDPPSNTMYHKAAQGKGFGAGAAPVSIMDTNRRIWEGVDYHGNANQAFWIAASPITNASSISSVSVTCNQTLDQTHDGTCAQTIANTCAPLLKTYAPGIAYHPVLDRVIGYPTANGGTFLEMDPGAFTCSSRTFSTNAPPTNVSSAPIWGVAGHFQYSKQLDLFVLVPAYADNSSNPVNTFVLNLNPSDPLAPCNISQLTLGPYTVGQVVSQTMTAGGCGGGTLAWTSSGLPAGLSGCNSVTGTTCVISGTLTTATTYTPTISLTDGGSNTASINPSVTVNAAVSITTSSPLPAGTVSTAYSQAIAANGGTAPLTWSVLSGTAPTGTSLSSGGVLSGTPTTTTGSPFTFTAKATDANGVFGTKSFTVTINPSVTATGTVVTGTLKGVTVR